MSDLPLASYHLLSNGKSYPLFITINVIYYDCIYTLSGRTGKVVALHAEGCKIESPLWLSCTDLYYARGDQGVRPMRVGGATSKLDLSSLTRFSVAGYDRLQLRVPNWATSVITVRS